MGWKDDLLPASFRGVPFEVLRTKDQGAKAVAEHEFPYRDGCEVEDLGRKARRISVTAVFWGDKYKAALERLTKALEERGPGELVHPVFGPVRVQVLDWDMPHEAERPDYCEVALSFVAAGADVTFFGTAQPKVDAKAATARKAAAGTLATAVVKAKSLRNLARAGLGAVSQLKATAGGVVTSGAEIVSAPAAWAADVSSLVHGVVDLRSFTSASLLPDFGAVLAALTSAILLPSSSSGGSIAAGGLGLVAGAELDVVTAHVEAERALGVAEAAQLVLEAEAQTPTLTPVEVEGVAASTRGLLLASVETYRGLYGVEQAHAVAEPLKDVALAVQQAAAAVIEAKPPMVTQRIAARTCPRLLAHQLYGDHARAMEIQRLNALRDPNFLTAGDEVKVYAS